MRAREFIKEFIELFQEIPFDNNDFATPADCKSVPDQDKKWTPPLQQQLDILKDVVQSQKDDIDPSTTSILSKRIVP